MKFLQKLIDLILRTSTENAYSNFEISCAIRRRWGKKFIWQEEQLKK